MARQIAANGGKPLGDAIGDNVVQQNVKAGERADMGDAVAHLPGADHADLAKGGSCNVRFARARGLRTRAGSFFRAFLNFDHFGSP